MEPQPEDIINLFDSCWFSLEILKNQSRTQNSLDSETNPDPYIPGKPMISSVPSILMRSKSDQLSSMASFTSDSLSPNSVLFTPHLQTILSGKEELKPPPRVKDEQHHKNYIRRQRERRKKVMSKSLSELEFEELKGFMDLGFVFSEDDRDSSLVEIIPGLQRLGSKDNESDVNDVSSVPRPYLSEAWEVLDNKNKETPLMNWKVPALSNEVEMKDSLKWWAQTVASTVIR